MSDDTTTSTDDTTTTTDDIESLPPWARDKLTTANRQAAEYRVKARDARTSAETAVKAEHDAVVKQWNDKYESANNDLALVRNEFDRFKAAVAAGVPGESIATFADLLKGQTPDELKAHAAELLKMFKFESKDQVATDASQGRFSTDSGSATGSSFGDIIKHALENKR